MTHRERAARNFWAWERVDVFRAWGVLLPPWEELSLESQERQQEMAFVLSECRGEG